MQINENVAYKIGQAFGTIIKKNNQKFTIVGYDNRKSSPNLFKYLSKGIIDTGVDVINVGVCTTPMCYFAWHHFKAKSGITITASHNPKEYNGFKFSLNGIYNTHDEEIQMFKDVVKSNEFEKGEGRIIEKDIKKDYVDFLFKNLNFGKKKLKIVFDAANGTASVIIKDVLKRLNVESIPIFCESDSDFPNHHPDPSVHKNLKDLIKTVLREKADAGFAFDGDGDRIGLIDEKGNIIEPDKIMIIAIRSIIDQLEDKRFIFDIKSSKALEDEIIKLKGIPILSRTGSSYLRSAIATKNIKFGGEYAGHIYFNDRFYGYDDAIYVALRLIEILSYTEKKCSQLLDGINHYYSTPEMKMSVPDNEKFHLIKKITSFAETLPYKIITIDGCKVIYDDGFALIRVSNTGPNLTFRFEATNQKKLKEIEKFWLGKTKEFYTKKDRF